MPEPFDTIQRIGVGVDSMTLPELHRAQALLAQWRESGRADVREAHRKVERRIDQLEGRPVGLDPVAQAQAERMTSLAAAVLAELPTGAPLSAADLVEMERQLAEHRSSPPFAIRAS